MGSCKDGRAWLIRSTFRFRQNVLKIYIIIQRHWHHVCRAITCYMNMHALVMSWCNEWPLCVASVRDLWVEFLFGRKELGISSLDQDWKAYTPF